MRTYKCELPCGVVDRKYATSSRGAARKFIDGAWRSGVVPHEDEYRVTVTDERGCQRTYDVHVEGIELDLSVMPVDGKR